MPSPKAVLSPLARDVYRACVMLGPMTVTQLCDQLGEGASLVGAALDELLDLELLAIDGAEATRWVPPHPTDCSARYTARPPRAPLGRVAEQRHRESVRALDLAARLGELWHAHRDPAPYLEFLETDAESSHAEAELLDDARDEVVALSIGPVGEPVQRPPVEVPDGFVRARGRGVEFRVVYGTSVLRDRAALQAVQSSMQLGEQARVCPDVPLNLRVADERRALLVVPGRHGERRHALLIHPSGLLDAMLRLFASYWRTGAPLSSTTAAVKGTPGPDRQTRELLTHLAAGLTDESIARELGVSERTVGRRIARLQERLGAASRFQLGLQASRRGWL